MILNPQLTALSETQAIDMRVTMSGDRFHSLGERRYGLQCTPRAAPGGVITRWNSLAIPPRHALPDTPRDAPWRPPN